MIETVKRAAQSRWAPVLFAGLLGAATIGAAQAESVASIQRNYNEATGQAQPYSPEAAAARGYAAPEVRSDACVQTFLSRRYNHC